MQSCFYWNVAFQSPLENGTASCVFFPATAAYIDARVATLAFVEIAFIHNRKPPTAVTPPSITSPSLYKKLQNEQKSLDTFFYYCYRRIFLSWNYSAWQMKLLIITTDKTLQQFHLRCRTGSYYMPHSCSLYHGTFTLSSLLCREFPASLSKKVVTTRFS